MKIKTSICILFCTVFSMIITATGSDFGKSSKSKKEIVLADDDTVYFCSPSSSIIYFDIRGTIFNAMDKRYIANRYLFTRKIRDNADTQKMFELISFTPNNGSNFSSWTFINSLNAADSWNYYINDKFMFYYSRVIVSTLMNHAIQKIEYVTHDTMKAVFHDKTGTPYKSDSAGVGAVRITTRNVFSKINSDKSTLYLLNGIEINRKIFDAIKPVFIRSLQRITDKERLAKYRRKNLKEAVEIETFKLKDVLETVTADGAGEKNLLIVDGIELDDELEYMFDINFFSEYYCISKYNDKYSVYQEKYPDKKGDFIVIVL